MVQLRDSRGCIHTLSKQIAHKGEAKIWLVREDPRAVAKIYHKPSREKELKLKAMITNPPIQPKDYKATAWPRDVLYEGGRFVGFLMPNISDKKEPLYFYNKVLRKKYFPNFNRKELHLIARNFVGAAKSVHKEGHLIGDINESNLLIDTQALVTIIDTDSFQVRDGTNIFRSPVGTPEYTPPELQSIKKFKEIDRVIEHDLFGITILIFRFLMEGKHPFAGVLPHGAAKNNVNIYLIKLGVFPYRNKRFVLPPPDAPPFDILHPEIQELFIRCFVYGHSDPLRRPTTDEWKSVLEKAEKSLKRCPKDKGHIYSDHLKKCPWCRTQKSAQKVLPRSRLPQKKKYARPNKWKRLLLLAAILVGFQLVPIDKTFFLSFMNRYAASWHKFTLFNRTYTVRSGDNLSDIAQKYPGVSVSDIVLANKKYYPSLAKNPNFILPGWKLKIPRQQ